MKRTWLCCVAWCLCALIPGSVVRSDEAYELDKFIQRGMRDWSLTGLAIAVVKDDRVVFLRGYGVRDIKTGKPVDEHTFFQLGSATKPLTASGIALMVQEGKLQWDTPVIERWPQFQVHDVTVTKQATLRDILCHRTGAGQSEGLLYYSMPCLATTIFPVGRQLESLDWKFGGVWERQLEFPDFG